MGKKMNLQKLNVPPLYVPVLVYLVSLALWVFTYYTYGNSLEASARPGFVEKLLPQNSEAAHLVSFVLMLLNSLLITQMNNRFSFIRTRSFIPSLIFLILNVSWVRLHGHVAAHLTAFLMLFAIFLSLDTYKNKYAQEHRFLVFLLLGLSTLMVPELLFLAPFFWLGYYFLKSSGVRSFLASLFGLLTPWLFLYGIRFFFISLENPFPDFGAFFMNYSLFYSDKLVFLGYFVLMSIVFVLMLSQMVRHSVRESLQTKDELNFLGTLVAGVALLIIVRFESFRELLPLIAFFFAVITSYSFSLRRSTFNNVVFIVTLVAGLLYLLITVFEGIIHFL